MRLYIIFLLGILIALNQSCQMKGKPVTVEERASALHETCLTVDSHTDTPFWLLREGFQLAGNPDSLQWRNQVDLDKMKRGGLDAVFFAVFVSQGELTPEGNARAIDRAQGEFRAIHEAVSQCNDMAGLGTDPEDAYTNEKEGRSTIYIGIENGYAIGDSIELIEAFYHQGARYITLCHTRNNAICDSSTDPEGPVNGGLSDFGRRVVQEMNRLGLMVDVSHISDKSFFDVLAVSRTPVIASHSDTRSLCDNPRNLTDSMLLALKRNGGVLQMCLLSAYVRDLPPNTLRDSAYHALRAKYPNYSQLSDAERKEVDQEWMEIDRLYPARLATVADLVDHIDHVVDLIGIDYVGIGSDFDGGGRLSDCQDASQMGNITLELARRGYSDEDIRKIWGGNFMRVFREVESYARKQKDHV